MTRYIDRFLNKKGFSPVGEVVSKMDVVHAIHSGCGEKPDQVQGYLAHKKMPTTLSR